MALNRLLGKENVECVGISEIDKYALMSYEAIHGDLHNYGDITKINGKDLPEIDILTWSFPCQDLSKAGQQKGLNNTRSGLGYEVIRIVEEMEVKPKVLLMENVPDLLSQKFTKGWHLMFNEIEKLGYSNYVEILNAKNYGVAQNRNRVFMVSILGDYTYTFPKGFELVKKLKDYLEPEVDESYFLSDKMIEYISQSGTKNFKADTKINLNVARAITTEQSKRAGITNYIAPNHTENFDLKYIPIPEKTKKGYALAKDGDGVYINRPHQKRGVVQKGIIQTIKTQSDDVGVVVEDKRNLKEKLADELLENKVVKDGDVINHSYTNSSKNKNSRLKLEDYIESDNGITPTLTTRVDTLGVVVKDTKNYIEHESLGSIDNSRRAWKEDKIMGTITTKSDNQKVLLKDKREVIGTYQYSKSDSFMKNKSRFNEGKDISDTIQTSQKEGVVYNNLRIRKLTPLESWRLMGIDDEDFFKAEKVVSNSQLYKQAGNAIVVDVLYYLFKNMF